MGYVITSNHADSKEKSMSRTTYVLSLASAAALGAGTAQLADFDAVAARPLAETYMTTNLLPLTHPMIAAIQTAVQTNLCPTVNAEFDLSGPTACTVPRDLQKLEILWHNSAEDTADVFGHFRLAGQWTPGESQ
jgi:hypothetical protein